MDIHSPKLRLKVTTPVQSSLAFCKPNVRDLKSWIQDLPKANIGETARLLYQALIELNNFKTVADNRIQLLELLRPEVMFINAQLEKHFLNNSIMLGERPQKIANLCQALQNHLTAGYKLVIADVFQQRSSILALALQRTAHSMFVSLVRAYQLYYPAPPLFWLELHQVYWLARKNNLHTQPIQDALLDNITEQSIEAAYNCVLLLSCSRINQMRQSDISILARTLPSWCQLATLQKAELDSSLFVVDLNSDSPPRYKELIEQEQIQSRLGFNTQELAEALIEHQQSPENKKVKARIAVPESMSNTLLAQLCSAWGNIAKRDFQRTNSKGNLELCLGMSAVHYYLAGQAPFVQTLKSHQVAHVEYNTDNRPPDIWANAIDAEVLVEQDPLQVDLIEYESTSTKEADAASEEVFVDQGVLYPVYTLSIVNHSPGGYCLAWRDAVPPQLQAGEIIALRENQDRPWSTAVTRWIRQAGSTSTQMGVELIAPNAQPCGLQLLRSGDTSSHFLRALLVPEIPALSRPASVIVPRIPFQEGHKVIINQHGAERRAVLRKRSMHTGSINQFEYSLLTPPQAVETRPASTLKSSTKNENFDSLWKSL